MDPVTLTNLALAKQSNDGNRLHGHVSLALCDNWLGQGIFLCEHFELEAQLSVSFSQRLAPSLIGSPKQVSLLLGRFVYCSNMLHETTCNAKKARGLKLRLGILISEHFCCRSFGFWSFQPDSKAGATVGSSLRSIILRPHTMYISNFLMMHKMHHVKLIIAVDIQGLSGEEAIL